jgi:hypothetical protein
MDAEEENEILVILLITNAEKAERNDNLGGKIKKGLVKNDG